MTKKIPLGFVITIVAMAIAITVAITYKFAINSFNEKIINFNERQQMYEKLATVDQDIRVNFYKEINDDKVSVSMIEAYLDALDDPQSMYMTEDEYKESTYNETKTDINDVKSEIVNNNVGCIKISSFSNGTDTRINNEVANLKSNNVDKLIIDLRNNDSDNVEFAAKALDIFIGEGELVNVIDKNNDKQLIYSSDESFIDMPINIIIDGTTSGAAEVFASAFKDFDRGKLIGGTTKGIGTQIKKFPMTDGTAIQISTGNYVTKSQNIFTGIGIFPDIQKTLNEEQQTKFNEGSLPIQDDPLIMAAFENLVMVQNS